MNGNPTPGVYRHYKGGEYRVRGVAKHTENESALVIYESLYDAPGYPKGSLWARPAAMFVEEVEMNGQKIARFTRVSD